MWSRTLEILDPYKAITESNEKKKTESEKPWKRSDRMKRDICKDNLICCDDNCQRCANLIYNIYMEQHEKLQKAEEIKVKQDNPKPAKQFEPG